LDKISSGPATRPFHCNDLDSNTVIGGNCAETLLSSAGCGDSTAAMRHLLEPLPGVIVQDQEKKDGK
jgi:hypothetical protein